MPTMSAPISRSTAIETMRATSGVAPTFSSCPVVISASTAPIAKPMSATTGSVSTPACWRRCGKRVRSRRVRPSSMRTQEMHRRTEELELPAERAERVDAPPADALGPRLRSALRPPPLARASDRRARAAAIRLRGRPPAAPARAAAVPLAAGPRCRARPRAPSRNRGPWPGRPRGSCPSAPARRRRGAACGAAAMPREPASPRPPGGARHAGSRSRTGGRRPHRRRGRRIPLGELRRSFVREGDEGASPRPGGARMISQTSLAQRPPLAWRRLLA